VKIGLYIEHGEGNGVGGAELMMAYLASAWSGRHHVDLIHHRPPLTRERLASFSSDDYSRVNVRYVPREPEPPPAASPLRRYRDAREWHRTVSEGYDLFVNCTHWLPCFSYAKRSALLVLFPFYVRPTHSDETRALPRWKQLRHAAYYGPEWNRRLATYRHRFAISGFAQEWTRRRWGIDCDIVHPPVDVHLESPLAAKEPLILSVGRFSTMAHTKKQLEMMETFRDLQPRLEGWSYASVGGLNTRLENHAYFERVRAAGAGAPTIVEANVDRARVKDLLRRARIFWHATGYGEDAAKPELAEHFGIATVEAMAAGCVPIVVNRGAQPDLVRHGQDGFVWDTLDQLARYTELVASDGGLREKLSASARERAQQFARERFLATMSARLGVA
jgi:glycosyltransferase involved in cell wall biosynthesis